MTKFVVLFFVCAVASTAVQRSPNPVNALAGIFKNGAIPTDAAVYAAIQEAVVIVRNLFINNFARLPDIHEKFVDKHDHLIEVDLTSGKLDGVEKLYSIDPPTIRVKDNYGLQLVTYRYPHLTVNYTYAFKHNGETKEGKIFAEEFLKCDIGFLTDRYTLKISDYHINCETDGPINIKLEEKINKDKRNKKIIKASVPIFKDLIERATKEKLEEVIVTILNNYNANIPNSNVFLTV